jgi:type I restriction enzyme S subunit
MEGATGRQRVPEKVLLDLPFPTLSGPDQRAISDTLQTVRNAIEIEEKLAQRHLDLKRATMR